MRSLKKFLLDHNFVEEPKAKVIRASSSFEARVPCGKYMQVFNLEEWTDIPVAIVKRRVRNTKPSRFKEKPTTTAKGTLVIDQDLACFYRTGGLDDYMRKELLHYEVGIKTCFQKEQSSIST